MKYKSFATFLWSFLAVTLCSNIGPGIRQPMSTYQSQYRRMRVAINEYRFSNPAECEKTAKAYYHITHPDDAIGDPKPLPSGPLVYSMQANGLDVEVRFVVVSADELKKYGKSINYWEVNRKQNGNDKKDIDDAIKEFKQQLGDTVIAEPFQDAANVNSKRPWRAVMKKKAASSPFEQARLLKENDVYGIVVNPPYP